MSSKEKELAKIEKKRLKAEKKRLKAEAKLAKERAEAEAARETAKAGKEAGAEKPQSASPEKELPIERIIEVKHSGIPAPHKSWKDNVWLYIVVAIVIGLVLWGINQILNSFAAG